MTKTNDGDPMPSSAWVPPRATDEYFGGCPVCGQVTGWANIGKAHWLFCEPHRLKWWIGTNLFSSWRQETEDVWRANAEMLQGMLEVKPVFPPPAAFPDFTRATDEDEVPF
jgi:hypothetical protein